MAVTFNDLIKDGTIKRGDQGFTIKQQDIHLKEGHNLRTRGPELDAYLEEMAEFTKANGITNMPQIKVWPREEGGVWAADGHCRTESTRIAIAKGADLTTKRDPKNVWLPIKPFIGDEIDRDVELLSSQSQRDLTPLETLAGFKRLAGHGMHPKEIAGRTGFKRQYVDQLLRLVDASPELIQMIRSGQVSADIASTMVGQHGAEATAEAEKELAKAESLGKKKITKGSMLGKALPRPAVDDLISRVRGVVSKIPDAAKELLEQYRTGKITDSETPVSIPVRELLALVACQSHIDDVRDEQERKARAAADKAKAKEMAAETA